jgi:hypothetical protein
MAHWRKSYPPTSHFHSFAGWMIGASVLVGTLMFIARARTAIGRLYPHPPFAAHAISQCEQRALDAIMVSYR